MLMKPSITMIARLTSSSWHLVFITDLEYINPTTRATQIEAAVHLSVASSTPDILNSLYPCVKAKAIVYMTSSDVLIFIYTNK